MHNNPPKISQFSISIMAFVCRFGEKSECRLGCVRAADYIRLCAWLCVCVQLNNCLFKNNLIYDEFRKHIDQLKGVTCGLLLLLWRRLLFPLYFGLRLLMLIYEVQNSGLTIDKWLQHRLCIRISMVNPLDALLILIEFKEIVTSVEFQLINQSTTTNRIRRLISPSMSDRRLVDRRENH